MTESSAASEAVIPWSLLRIVLFLIALSSPPISRTPDPELFVSVVRETVAFRTSRRAMAAPDWLPIRVPITVWFLPPVIRRPAPPPERRRPSVITTFSTPVSSTRWNRTGRDQFVTRRFLTVTFESERPVKLIPPEPRLAATIGYPSRERALPTPARVCPSPSSTTSLESITRHGAPVPAAMSCTSR